MAKSTAWQSITYALLAILIVVLILLLVFCCRWIRRDENMQIFGNPEGHPTQEMIDRHKMMESDTGFDPFSSAAGTSNIEIESSSGATSAASRSGHGVHTNDNDDDEIPPPPSMPPSLPDSYPHDDTQAIELSALPSFKNTAQAGLYEEHDLDDDEATSI